MTPYSHFTEKQKKELESEAVKIDLDSLIDAKIDKRLRITEKIVRDENNKIRIIIKEQTDLIKSIKSSKVNDVIHYVLIGSLIIVMLFLHGCM